MSVQTDAGRITEGNRAAFGKRRPLKSAIRTRLLRGVRLRERLNRLGRAEYLEFVPPVRDVEELSDVSGRVNWYLPVSSRRIPIHLARSFIGAPADPSAVPYLDRSLVTDALGSPDRPKGRAHYVIHRLTPRSFLSTLLHPRCSTLADPRFAFAADDGYFALHRAFCTTSVPAEDVSLKRLLLQRVPSGEAFVLATGPSARDLDPQAVSAQVRVICNSAVRDRSLLELLSPNVIAFSDPVFHFGPSRYAASFRTDLAAALKSTDAIFVTNQLFVEPLVAAMPSIVERLVVVPITRHGPWRWPTKNRLDVRATGNVLTNLMLPIAFALADSVTIAGCDGRDPNERYFWRHNASTQYDDDLMGSVFQAHPAFFRDRDYADYYAEHCEQLEALLTTAELAGKRVRNATKSHIPALVKRGATSFGAEEHSPAESGGG